MKFFRRLIPTLVCLTALALISSACQSIAPTAATPTAAVTEAPAPTAEPYPEPYPLATYDPYLAPVVPVEPYPSAYPAQGAPLAPGGAGGLYPGVQDGAEVLWVQAVSMILNSEVTQVMQTHDLKVYLTLKDGRTLLSMEPEIDAVMSVIQYCGDPCKAILIATE